RLLVALLGQPEPVLLVFAIGDQEGLAVPCPVEQAHAGWQLERLGVAALGVEQHGLGRPVLGELGYSQALAVGRPNDIHAVAGEVDDLLSRRAELADNHLERQGYEEVVAGTCCARRAAFGFGRLGGADNERGPRAVRRQPALESRARVLGGRQLVSLLAVR